MAGHVFRGSLMFGIVMILVAGGPAAGQDTASNDAWQVPRTPDGQPDLQGVWTNGTITPFERGTSFSYSGVTVPDADADKAFFTEEEAARIRRVMSETVLFSAAENDDGGDRNLFVVRDTNEHAQSEVLHTNTIPKEIIKALDRLEGREREVIARRFGLEGEKPQTLEQIGTRMNLSRERIRQIEKEALGHMKQIPGLQEVYEDLGKAAFNGYTSNN